MRKNDFRTQKAGIWQPCKILMCQKKTDARFGQSAPKLVRNDHQIFWSEKCVDQWFKQAVVLGYFLSEVWMASFGIYYLWIWENKYVCKNIQVKIKYFYRINIQERFCFRLFLSTSEIKNVIKCNGITAGSNLCTNQAYACFNSLIWLTPRRLDR